MAYTNRREHWPQPAQAAYRQKAGPAAGGNGDEHGADLAAVARADNRLLPTVAEARSTEQEQRLRHLLKFAQLRPDLSVIDIGPGQGHYQSF